MKILLVAAMAIVMLGVLFNGLLALFIVPAPGEQTAFEVSGRVERISRPHPQYGDLAINLAGGRNYYVNRADEVTHFDWERLLDEVRPGDIVTLTVVRPLAWRLLGIPGTMPSPIAGVRTASTVYMDPAIAAATWTAQATAVRSTVLLLFLLAMLFVVSGRLRR